MNAMKDLNALVSFSQQCLVPVGFVAVGNRDYLPEVHPSSTHVSIRKGTGAFTEAHVCASANPKRL